MMLDRDLSTKQIKEPWFILAKHWEELKIGDQLYELQHSHMMSYWVSIKSNVRKGDLTLEKFIMQLKKQI